MACFPNTSTNGQYHATGHYDRFGIIFVTSVPFKKRTIVSQDPVMYFFVRIMWADSLRFAAQFYLQDTECLRQSTSKTKSAFHKKVHYLFPVSWIQPLSFFPLNYVLSIVLKFLSWPQ